MATKRVTTKEVQNQAGRKGAVVAGRVVHADYDTGLINPEIAFVVFGAPAAQGSKKHIGGGRLIEASPGLPAWRDAVREQAKLAIIHKGDDWNGPIEEPVLIEVVFTFAHTAASRKRGDVYYRNSPDLDKLQRAVGDAISPVPLKKGVAAGMPPAAAERLKESLREEARKYAVLANDSCIVAWHAKKVYAEASSDALRFPGVSIEVWRLSELHQAKLERTGD